MKVLLYDTTFAFLTPGGKTTHAVKLQKEISRLRKNIYNANSILNKLVVMKPWENTDDPMRKIYRPIKNTTKQEVYRAIVELENILQGDE